MSLKLFPVKLVRTDKDKLDEIERFKEMGIPTESMEEEYESSQEQADGWILINTEDIKRAYIHDLNFDIVYIDIEINGKLKDLEIQMRPIDFLKEIDVKVPILDNSQK